MSCKLFLSRITAIGLSSLIASVNAEEFRFDVPPSCETAIVFDGRLTVKPLKAGEKEFKVDVKAQPFKTDDGRVIKKAVRPFVSFFPGRTVNVAPHAYVTVSSHGKTDVPGFKPQPGLNKPLSLVDNLIHPKRSFSFAARKVPPSVDDPEWVVLSWPKAIPLAGVMVFLGEYEGFPRPGNAVFEVYVGKGDARLDRNRDNWRSLETQWKAFDSDTNPSFRAGYSCVFKEIVSAEALRLKLTGIGRTSRGRNEITPGLGEIAVFTPWVSDDAPKVSAPSNEGKVEWTFDMPFDGTATIQIRDEEGRVVANPVTALPYSKGQQKASWDLTDVDGKALLKPGRYTWRGVAIPPLNLDYRFSYYPLGLPPDRRTWMTEDKTGGWLADHDPPRGVARAGDKMWLNAWAEFGDSVIETDIDARKLWGVTRIWVAVPQEICVDGDYVYGYSQGGWNGTDEEIVRINQKTKETKKVFLLKNPPAADKKNSFWDVTVTGFQVLGERAFVSYGPLDTIRVYDISAGNNAKMRHFSWASVHTQFDELKPVLVKTISLPRPGRLRKYGKNSLVTVTAEGVVTLDIDTFKTQTLFKRVFDCPLGLGVGENGLLWIGEGGATHQVTAYTSEGKEVARLGKKGRRKLGAWDENDLEEPAGVEVDAQGRVWVAEHTHWEKRVSIWDASSCRCVKSILGPTQYGGDGCIDPENPERLFYRGLEVKRNQETGKITPVALIYRPDSGDMQRFPGKKGKTDESGDYPSYAFRAKGRLWFTSFMPPHGHARLVLWMYDGMRVRPAASFGTTSSITNCVSFDVSPERDGRFYTWSDLDGDGFMQKKEMKFGDILHEGKPLKSVLARWNWRMNESFAAAGITDLGYRRDDPHRVVVFRPYAFTSKGIPLYNIPSDSLPGPRQVDALMPDSKGGILVLGSPVTGLGSDGSVKWTYRSDWPGLHAGHRTTARGDEPGVLIAPTRIWGMARTSGDAGEVAVFNSNLGCAYLMSVEEGFFLGRIFRDSRVAPTVWNFNFPPDSSTLAETTLYDEHFGGTFSRIRDKEGKERDMLVVGKGDCSVVELSGLDGVCRLTGGTIKVTSENVQDSLRRRSRAAERAAEPKLYSLSYGKSDSKYAAIENIRLGCDENYLYISGAWRDDLAPFANSGDNPFELFKTGDTLDVMLRTRAPVSARGVQEGDVRLLFAPFKGGNVCVLYDFISPKSKGASRMAFSSPWRTLYVDKVSIVESAKVKVDRRGANVKFEAQVPLSALPYRPKGDVKGDVGRVSSDATGTRSISRNYWSNKNTAIMSDLPSEASIEPNLWGTLRFPEIKK